MCSPGATPNSQTAAAPSQLSVPAQAPPRGAPVDPGLAINAAQAAKQQTDATGVATAARASAAVRRSGAGLAVPTARAGLQLPQ